MHGPSHGSRPPSGGRCHWAQRGFTIVELVVVMLLMATLAGITMSHFADREPFSVQAAADRIVAALRLAQGTALAQRRDVHVVLVASPASLAVCRDAACTQPIAPPGGEAWLDEVQGLRLNTGASFVYGPGGDPSLTTLLTLQVLSDDTSHASQPIRVEPISGHVHSP